MAWPEAALSVVVAFMIGLLIVSTGLQILAAGLAVRLTRFTRRDFGWGLISAAMILMCVRRCITLYDLVTGHNPVRLEPIAEIIAITVSLLMIAGLVFISPFFESSRKAALESAEHAHRQSALLEALPDLIFIIRYDGSFVDIITKNSKVLQMPAEELVSKNVIDFLPPASADLFREAMRSLSRETGMKILEYEVPFRGVTSIWESRFVALDDQQVLLLARDMTQRRKAEDDRRRIESQLLHAQKLESLGVLAGGIAHDFNNLLTGILGNASLALMELPETSPAQPSLKQIELAAQRAGDLTKQLLAYAGKGRFLIQPLSLSKIVEEMADLMQTVISKKAILKFDFDANIPDIRADATQIRQIVMNLITNASDAIGEKSGVIRLHTGVMFAEASYLRSTFVQDEVTEGYFVFLEVSDTGCGMAEETMQRIFDPFFTTKFTGRGLGLAAALGIVRGHKGAIKVYTEPQRGTTFKVLFPAAPAGEKPGIDAPSFVPEWQGRGTILVVDDEDTVRAVTKRTLESAGFQVLLAANGAIALDTYREHADKIVCVLLDLTMPRMGGEEAFRELRKLKPNVNVVLMSGYNEQEITNQFAGKGLAGFIQKPFRAGDLIAAIRRTLERSVPPG